MTRAERTRSIKYVLAESSRLLHRRRDTKINIRTGMQGKKKKERKTKNKEGSKAQKQARRKIVLKRLQSNKSSLLCYKAETETLSHHLPSSSCSRRQRYQVSLLPLSSPPLPRTNQRKTKQNCLDSGAVATQVPLFSRTVTLPHDLLFHFCIRRQQYQYGCPFLSCTKKIGEKIVLVQDDNIVRPASPCQPQNYSTLIPTTYRV